MTALRDEIVNIIEGERLTPIFQPIISLLHKDILGYEALIRGPSDSSLHSPHNLFSAAERHGLSTKLEFCCRKISIQYYSRLKLAKKLFINVSPSVLLQPDFKIGMTLKYLEQAGIDPKSVVIELTESQPTDNYPLMRDAVMHYRQMGFEIALDDLGAGYSGLRLWSELLPDYVKIDKHFIHGIHEDSVKYNFVRSIQSIASSLNCNIIAEGVETKEEFKTVESLGITYAQGYYFARPTAQPPERIDPALLVSNRISPLLVHSFNSHSSQAKSIAKTVEPVTSATSISQVMDLFQQNSHLTMIPVVDNLLATGIVFRDRFLSKLFSSRYGLELYGKKPISLFVSKMPLMIDAGTPLETVSQMLTSTTEHDSAFIVTENSYYLGIATVLDLLEEITRQQIINAKHANPLTLLPGSVPVNERINYLLHEKIPFALAYFDLDNFKPYNDKYGYSAGDNVIKALAELLSKFVDDQHGIIGHIGGDDFIVVFLCDDWLVRCQNMLSQFADLALTFYSEEDRHKGGIVGEDRNGLKTFFALVSLSIGIVDSVATSQCLTHVDLADLAAGAKKQAKKISGNSLFINQRLSFRAEMIDAVNNEAALS